jgi:dihydroxy-acid dehydratase
VPRYHTAIGDVQPEDAASSIEDVGQYSPSDGENSLQIHVCEILIDHQADANINSRGIASSASHNASQSNDARLNKVSSTITQPKSQGASQAMLYATGMTEEGLSKAQVGISSVWYTGNPCNMHLLDLNHRVKEGVERAGLIGYQFNTIGVSDGISMGTKGMRYSLQSRDLIADSIETVMGGQWYDANISIPGCDKNMPGVMMAMGRVNRPSLMVYGGSIKPGCAATQNNADIDIVSAFQAYGQFITGEITEEQRFDVIRHACPGQGACGGMYTANTMATAIEVMGMSLPGSSSNPAESQAKYMECLAAGGAIKNLLQQDIRPRDIMTRQAFENAMIVVNITGGSTNAVLHLIAIADSVGVKLTIDDFQAVSDRIPFLADLKPSGKYVMNDLYNIGGTPSLLKFLLKEGIIDGSGMTVTGKTLAQNLENVPDFPADQKIIRPLSNPIKPTGHIQILRGSLAPGGSVGKITGKEGLRFVGKAKCYDDEDDFIAALEEGAIKKGEKTVVVIRYEGPKGGPGMPEMLKPSSAIMGAGLGNDVALITDGRFSGGSHGFLIGHIVPEAQEGGPIGLVRDGDEVVIDAETRVLDLMVEEEELERRRKEFVPKPLKYKKGTLAKYARNVSDASHGCITDGELVEA